MLTLRGLTRRLARPCNEAARRHRMPTPLMRCVARTRTAWRLQTFQMLQRLVLASVAWSLALAAQAAPLTFADALRQAETTAPSLRAKAVDVDAARSLAIAAGRLPDPRLQVGVSNFPISGPPAGSFSAEGMTMATIGVSQEAPNGAKRAAQQARARADIVGARSDQALEARDVRIATADAWVNLYYAQRRLTALDDVQTSIEPLRKIAPALVASGTDRPARVVEPERLRAQLADRRAELVAAARRAKAELARWTGDPDPQATGEPPGLQVNVAKLRLELLENPLLAAFDARTRQAQADVALARAETRPDWSFEAMYQRRDERYGDMVSAGVSVSLPLFAGTRQNPVISARRSSLNRARLEQEAAQRQLLAALEGDLADHTMNLERYERAKSTLLPLARQQVEFGVASYAAGGVGLADVLTGFLALAEAHMTVIDREAETTLQAARITFTYGSDQ